MQLKLHRYNNIIISNSPPTHAQGVPGGASVKYLECDSTCNSENSEEEEDGDDKPPVATGMDLVYMTRALELSEQSGDPRTKVRTSEI